MNDNICNGKHKQIRSSWQNDMLKQWVMHWAFKHDVLGSIHGLKIEKFIFTTNCHCCKCSAFLSA